MGAYSNDINPNLLNMSINGFDMVIEDVSSDAKRVVFGIDDTGFRVEYYFVLNGEEWYLNRIVDLSM